MNRIIPCIVSNEYVKGDGVAVGAAGSHNDVVLELHFTDFWEGLAKSITWLDANGENPTVTLLTTDMLKPGEADIYLVPIPAEPKRVAGTMTMSIKGAAVSGESETRASLTTTAHFKVLESVYDEDAAEAGDITATQAEQMQGQLESILNDIVLAGQAADAKEAAEASAAAAEASAEAAVTQANAAAQSASSALFSEQQAQTFANAAQTAQSNAEAAQSSAEAAADEADASATAAQTAKTGAESARDAAESAKTGAENAATEAASSEDEARQYALDASASANMAATNAASAGAAATAASGSASAAAGSAAQAQQYAEQAGQIVGGDFATKTELSTGLAGKADLVGGKVPASQLPAMDYDASGSASAALTAAMSYADGLAGNYDAAGAAAGVQSNLNSHVADTTKHITEAERTSWNGKVPATRTVNGKALSSDITLSASDVGARPDTWMPTAEDVGARPSTWTPAAADIPNLAASKITSGTLAVARGGTGKTSLAALATALGAAKVETGSYVGTRTGTAGSTGKTLNLSFTPKAVLIIADNTAAIIITNAGVCFGRNVMQALTASVSGNSITWNARAGTYVEYQMDYSGTTYNYIAIG